LIFPETMSKAEIISLKENTDKIVTEILKFGMFEPRDPSIPISQGRIEGARRLIGEIQEHISKLKIIMDLAGLILEPAGKLKINEDWITTSERISKEAEDEETRYKELLEEIGKIRGEIDLYKSQMETLAPFSEITVSLENLGKLDYFDVIFSIVTITQLEELKNNKNIFVAYRLLKNGNYAAIIISLKGTQEEYLTKLGIRKFETPAGESPYDAYNEALQKVKSLEEILTTTRSQLSQKVRDNSSSFRELLGKLMTIRDALNVLSKVRVSDNFIQLEGYVPEKKVKELKNKLDKIEAFIDFVYPKRYGETEEPPT